MACAENEIIEIKAVLKLGCDRDCAKKKKMLKMKVYPTISLKINGE